MVRQEAFFPPGTIDITQLRAMQRRERAPGGGKLMSRPEAFLSSTFVNSLG